MCKVKSAAQIANEFDELERLEEMPYEDLTAEQKKRLLTLTKELRDSTSA